MGYTVSINICIRKVCIRKVCINIRKVCIRKVCIIRICISIRKEDNNVHVTTLILFAFRSFRKQHPCP